jgi:hypothetical protein
MGTSSRTHARGGSQPGLPARAPAPLPLGCHPSLPCVLCVEDPSLALHTSDAPPQ